VGIKRLGLRAQAAAASLIVIVVLAGGGLAPNVRAAADPSDVVLVLDFSASILDDAANRNRFAAALDRMAARVDETVDELVAGDATVSIVQFATRALDYPGCADVRLLSDPAKVAAFAGCLRSVAAAYRQGLTAATTKRLGVDTNYVAAMERAAAHLPADSVRPALILFTDGRHDVKGIPAGAVQPARERLFGSRTPFALLPVGMGLAPSQRAALAAGLEALRIIKDMPACVSGAQFEWPQVVFDTADQAGNAVALALQNATCTFTVAPTPVPSPTPTPVPLAPLQGIRAIAGDGQVELSWSQPAAGGSAPKITDYRARCRAGEGDWIESTEGVSLEPKATVTGLTNGVAYQCEVAPVGTSTSAEVVWTPAGGITPIGKPAAPAKPTVEARNGAVAVSIGGPADPTSRYHLECSGDSGATWPATTDTSTGDNSAVVAPLTNGVDYVCRAFAENAIGISAASPLSDAVRPCSGPLECNGLLLPVLGGLGALLLGGILLALTALYRGRTTGYVIAVVDVVHSANVGHGSTLGIGFLRDPNARTITGIVADRGSTADIRIRRRRDGTFVVRDRSGRHEVADGDAVVVTDGTGGRHSLVLRAFDTNAASEVARRR
jgi:hypothetical protein